MNRPSFHAFFLALGLLACGSSGPLVLLDGEVTGSFNGTPFTMLHGYAFKTTSGPAIVVLSEDELICPTENDPNPVGHTAMIGLTHFGPPSFISNPTVQLFQYIGGALTTVTGSAGELQVVSANNTSFSGNLTFSYTDAEAHVYEVNGFFEVTTCVE